MGRNPTGWRSATSTPDESACQAVTAVVKLSAECSVRAITSAPGQTCISWSLTRLLLNLPPGNATAARSGPSPFAVDIRGVVWLSALKGGTYQINWGLSVAWIPPPRKDAPSIWEEGQYHGAVIGWQPAPGGMIVYDLAQIDSAWAAARSALKALDLMTTAAAVARFAQTQVDSPSGSTIAIHDPRPEAVLIAAESRR
jgi:hypothetical protein